MIRLSAKKLRKGMIISQGIYNARGAFLLRKGTRLTEQYVKRLQKMNIHSLSVTALQPHLNVSPPDDIILEKTRIKAIDNVSHVFDDVQTSGKINTNLLKDTAESIIFDLIQNRNNLLQITDMRLHDNYTFSHSVNVAVIASMIGTFCHYSKQNLLELTLGALMHDIGKIFVPENILQKPYPLNSEETVVINRHPHAGFAKLKEAGGFSDTVLAIAIQHHERFDGSGYPHHYVGSDIHRFARIVSIADVYDALTSNRPYKRAYRPDIAYKIMTQCSCAGFDPDLLKLFFANVAIYPVGTVLKTRFGDAIVTKVESGYTLRPHVCLFTDKHHQPVKKPSQLDLRDFLENPIEYVIEDNELFELINMHGIDPARYLLEMPPVD
jgi:uncharacterized domain HDIG